MTSHIAEPLPSAAPRSVDLYPQDADNSFAAYSKRVDHAIAMAIPALLSTCEWSGETYNHRWPASTPPADWKSRAPLAYIRNGTESPIVTLALYSRSTGAMEPIWTAKIFDDAAALSILTWLTRSANWMQ